MKKLIIITFGDDISSILEVALNLNYDIEVVNHDINKLETFSLKSFSENNCFIAFKKTFLGLPVKYIFKEAYLRKIKLINLVSPSSSISRNTRIGSNVFVGRSVNIKDGVILDDCIMIDSGSTIGVDVHINSFTFIGKDVQIYSNSVVSANCYIGDGATLKSITIGEFCCLEKPILYDENYPSKTHLLLHHRASIKPF
jgi:acyl-[acyl carrier protein]--UDP-N-acetylglucosamine O-acyltransferase